MSAQRLATLAAQREALRSISALQRRRLALEAAILADICDPAQQGSRLWKGVKRHPALTLLPLLALFAQRPKGSGRATGPVHRMRSLWRLCRRQRATT